MIKSKQWSWIVTAAIIAAVSFVFIACKDDADSNTEERPPLIVDAGETQTFTLSDDLTVTLDGITSNGNISAYAWECISYTADKGQVYVPYSAGEVTSLIIDADKAEAAVDLRKAGTYVFRLTVTDDHGDSNKNNLTIIIEPPSAATAAVKITGRDFPLTGASELNLSVKDYCSFEGSHDGFSEDDFKKITFDFFSDSYEWDGPSAERSKESLDKYTADGIIPVSEYEELDMPLIIQTFYYDNQPSAIGSRSFWTYKTGLIFDGLYDGDPNWNTLSEFPEVTLTLSKQITDLVPSTETVTEISVISQPAKTAYNVGDALDFTGLVVQAKYSNNTTQNVAIGENHVRGFNFLTNANKPITISFSGESATFTITMIAPTVTFNPNGGYWDNNTANTANKTQQTNWNTVIDAPPSPKYIQFNTFDGWYAENSSIVWNFSTNKITANITLYAKWIVDTEAVTNWLLSQSGGTSESNPIDLILSVDLGDMSSTGGYYGNGWINLLNAIADADKFINLDLSACTMKGTDFNPYYTSSISSQQGKSKIVNIVLPDTAISIASMYGQSQPTFMYFDSLKSFNGTGLTTIGNFAFSCFEFSKIDIPETITSIGSGSFIGCFNLSEIILPDGITHIGGIAFYDCDGLIEITLPASLTSIGDNYYFCGAGAFYHCSNLSLVICLAEIPPKLIYPAEGYYNILFDYTHPSLQIKVPADSVTAYKTAPGWDVYADRISAIGE